MQDANRQNVQEDISKATQCMHSDQSQQRQPEEEAPAPGLFASASAMYASMTKIARKASGSNTGDCYTPCNQCNGGTKPIANSAATADQGVKPVDSNFEPLLLAQLERIADAQQGTEVALASIFRQQEAMLEAHKVAEEQLQVLTAACNESRSFGSVVDHLACVNLNCGRVPVATRAKGTGASWTSSKKLQVVKVAHCRGDTNLDPDLRRGPRFNRCNGLTAPVRPGEGDKNQVVDTEADDGPLNAKRNAAGSSLAASTSFRSAGQLESIIEPMHLRAASVGSDVDAVSVAESAERFTTRPENQDDSVWSATLNRHCIRMEACTAALMELPVQLDAGIKQIHDACDTALEQLGSKMQQHVAEQLHSFFSNAAVEGVGDHAPCLAGYPNRTHAIEQPKLDVQAPDPLSENVLPGSQKEQPNSVFDSTVPTSSAKGPEQVEVTRVSQCDCESDAAPPADLSATCSPATLASQCRQDMWQKTEETVCPKMPSNQT